MLGAPFKKKKTKRPDEGSATAEEGRDESSAREASDESIFDTLRGTKCDLWSRVETVGVYYRYVLSILRQGSEFKSALCVFFVTLFLKVYLNPDGFICRCVNEFFLLASDTKKSRNLHHEFERGEVEEATICGTEWDHVLIRCGPEV